MSGKRRHCGTFFAIDFKAGDTREGWCILPARPRHRTHCEVKGGGPDMPEAERWRAIKFFEQELARRATA